MAQRETLKLEQQMLPGQGTEQAGEGWFACCLCMLTEQQTLSSGAESELGVQGQECTECQKGRVGRDNNNGCNGNKITL